MAQEIVRNNEDIRGLASDIESEDHRKELLNEYSMRYFLMWLVTGYGSDVFQADINSNIQEKIRFSIEFLMTTGWYPFQSSLEFENEIEIIGRVIDFLNSDISTISGELTEIGLLFEHLTCFSLMFEGNRPEDIQIEANSKSKRRIKGQFYTPPNIVRYSIEASLDNYSPELMKGVQSSDTISREDTKSSFPDILKKCISVMDPASGTGNFLLGYLDLFEKSLNDFAAANSDSSDHTVHQNQEDYRSRFLEQAGNLYGIDIDGRAVCLSRLTLLIKTWRLLGFCENEFNQLIGRLENNLICTDSTLVNLHNGPDSHLSREKKFDLVITNPPYLSFGARNLPTIARSTHLLYKQFYPDSSEYKIRLNAIFHDIAFRMTRDGGRLSLLVPDSFLTGRRYSKLREGILNRSRIVSLTEFPQEIFPGATAGRWCLAVLEKERPEENSDYKLEVKTFCETEPEFNIDSEQNSPISYDTTIDSLVGGHRKRFHLIFHSMDDRILARLKGYPLLKSLLRGHTGIRSRVGQKNIIAESDSGGNYKPGLISGAEVRPFSVDWKGSYLNIDPNILYSGGFDPEVIGNPKIFVRQTGDSIVAALESSGLYHLNNVHSFSNRRLREESARKENLKDLVGIMNSSIYKYVYRMRTREAGMALAQIDIETLEEMPIPLKSMPPDFSIMVEKMEHLTNEEKSAVQKEIDLQFNLLNRMVYEAFELDQDEMDWIEQQVGREKRVGKNW